MDLTADYENGAFIPGADRYPDAWAAEAVGWRGALGDRLRHVPLARGLAAELHLPEGAPRGLAVFVHGGYWRRFGPESFSWASKGALARGLAVALPAYPLCPAVRIRDITAHIHDACTRLAGEVPGVPVTVAGHSAGGHLAARMAVIGLPRLAACVPISPVADLAPLMHTQMNADLRLDAEEAAEESPARQRPREGVATRVWVGAEERPAFLDQARLLAAAWDAPLRIAPGRHHFDVLDGLRDPEDPLTAALDPG